MQHFLTFLSISIEWLQLMSMTIKSLGCSMLWRIATKIFCWFNAFMSFILSSGTTLLIWEWNLNGNLSPCDQQIIASTVIVAFNSMRKCSTVLIVLSTKNPLTAVKQKSKKISFMINEFDWFLFFRGGSLKTFRLLCTIWTPKLLLHSLLNQFK